MMLTVIVLGPRVILCRPLFGSVLVPSKAIAGAPQGGKEFEG
jgi:hypothetical protein